MNIIAATHEHENIVRSLFSAYANELQEDLCFQGFSHELAEPFKKYAEPAGCILLAMNDQEAIGCIALQKLSQPKVCEMKRLYVKPEYRSTGAGHQLVNQLLLSAVAKGYTRMVLDTLSRLQPAIKLYEQYGFANTNAYYSNPLPGVVYMSKELQ